MNLKEILKLNPWKNFINIKVIPNSPKTEFVWVMADGALKLSAKWLPEKGKVNDEITKMLSKEFGIKRDNINIISWATSRNKLIRIDI